ncbi:hypothetical protein Bca4012_020021 [Brassica carinata]
MNEPVGPPDEDEVLLMHVQAIEASLGVNSESKDEDKSGEPFEAGFGVNPESECVAHKKSCEQDKEKICGEDIAVDNIIYLNEFVANKIRKGAVEKIWQWTLEKDTEANIEAASGEIEVDWVENMEDDMGEDEDDEPKYDYNHWHDYARNNCVIDDEDDFEEGPRKGGSGGQFGVNGNQCSGTSGGRGQGSGKPPAGRDQRSSAAGGSKSMKNPSKRRRSEENTNLGSDYLSTSRTVSCSYTEGTETDGGVDVVLVTPPKLKNQHKRVTEDDDFVDPPIPIPESTEDEGGEALTDGGDFVSRTPLRASPLHNQETDTVESGDVVLVTPPKQYNKHNRVIEDDKNFVDPLVIQTSQVQGGEAFIKGLQVPEMYGFNDVGHVYNEMDGSSFQPLDINFSKEDSDIYVGRMFKDKVQCKLTLAIYAITKVCTFKLTHCKRRITAKCVNKECMWRVLAVQLGDSPTYQVKKEISGHVCKSDVRGKYKKHGTSKVLAALLRSKHERLHSGPRAMELPEVLRTEFNYTCTYNKSSKVKEQRRCLTRCYLAKDKWYPRVHHGICLVHLQCKVNEKYKGLQQKDMVGRTGEAFKVKRSMSLQSLRIGDVGIIWRKSTPTRDSPIVALLEFIRRMLCRWYEIRRCEISKMKGNIPNEMEKILVEQFVLSKVLLVLPCSTWQFKVTHRPNGYGFHVDLEKRTCSCLEFQMLGLPYRHAIAAEYGLQHVCFGTPCQANMV